jgi:hypothetical protein
MIMREKRARLCFTLVGSVLILVAYSSAWAHEPHVTNTIGDLPVLSGHVSQDNINNGLLSFADLFSAGSTLFTAKFNTLDGAERPEATGAATPTKRTRQEFPNNFNRSSGPDANSCDGCHARPRAGGGTDNAANAFTQAETLDFTTSIDPTIANERNGPHVFGSGAIEMLAREMTVDLQGIRDAAIAEASSSGQALIKSLDTKGVNFGVITAFPNGSVDASQVEGVDTDLVVRPFSPKGTVVSLRVFSINPMNRHFGMQAAERFGDGVDFDVDGIVDELGRGDITAITVWQAAQAIPGQRILTNDPEVAEAILLGEDLFNQIGCASCHVSEMTLNNPLFSEPNPFNPTGNLSLSEVPAPFTFDLTQQGSLPRLEKTSDGKAIVRAFTDLKRHHMGDELNNEQLVQAGVPTDVFMTTELWGLANTGFLLHHGRATTIGEAILKHGGEAQAARDAFAALSDTEQRQVVEFLKSLVVLDEGTPSLVVDEDNNPVDKTVLRQQPGL